MYMKHMNIVQFNSWAKTNIVDENKFDDNGFIIMENSKNYKSTGIIAKISMTIRTNFTLILIKKFIK